MKKIAIIVAVFGFVFIHSIRADIRFGVKVGVDLANASFNKDVVQTSNFTGFQAGPVLELGIFDIAALYSQQGMKFKFNDIDFEKNESRLDVPVNLKLKLGTGGIGCFLAAGPYANFRLSGDDFLVSAEGIRSDFKSKSFGAGINIGGGISLLGLQIGVNYRMGLTDDYKSFNAVQEGLAGFKGKTRVWSITAACFF
jgi:hypothetical protein